VSSKRSPPELRSYKQNQGTGQMPQTRPEVNPKSFVPKKKLRIKTVGFVGASLARGKYGFDLGRSRGFYSGEEEKRALGRMGECKSCVISAF